MSREGGKVAGCSMLLHIRTSYKPTLSTTSLRVGHTLSMQPDGREVLCVHRYIRYGNFR
jgi:hypothetical protein